MALTLNIREDRTVELIRGENDNFVQGECCATEFVFAFPETVLGVDVDNYTKTIEFGECKEFGECIKFVDNIVDDTYDLKEFCTLFKKIMVQIVLTRIDGGNKTVWKTIPFVLDFHESVNAEGTKEIQSQLLSLAEIEADMEAFVKANCIYIVYSPADIPTLDNANYGVMLYLGLNVDDYIYGHYYRVVNSDDGYIWEDTNPDLEIIDVANGIREINKNRIMQLFVGTTAEYEALGETPNNGLFIFEDDDTAESLDELEANVNGLLNGTKTAYKATRDGQGNVISSTYAKKTEVGGSFDASGDYPSLTAGNALKVNGIGLYKEGDLIKFENLYIVPNKISQNLPTNSTTLGDSEVTFVTNLVGEYLENETLEAEIVAIYNHHYYARTVKFRVGVAQNNYVDVALIPIVKENGGVVSMGDYVRVQAGTDPATGNFAFKYDHIGSGFADEVSVFVRYLYKVFE